MGRDGAGGEAIGDLLGRIVVVGDKIFKLVAAHALVQVDTVHAANHLAAACAEMLCPELGNLSSGVLILERLCPAEHRERLFFHNLAIHVLTTFQCQFNPKRSKGADRASAFSQCGRCEAVESDKSLGEAVRRIVAELQRDVDDLPVRRENLQPGGGEPALTDVVARRYTAQQGKTLLKVKRG